MTSRSAKKCQRPFLYRSLASWLKEVCGRPVRKIPLDPGFGCPNRDGTLGSEGCAFCNPASFVPAAARTGVDPVSRVREWKAENPGEPFIAYLQAGSGTHADPGKFRTLVEDLCQIPGNVGLFVATRPDCVDPEILQVLEPWLHRRLIWLELGLQSAHDRTLEAIGRGHDAASFVSARELARQFGIPVLAHVILGLPGEGAEEMLDTARFLAGLEVEGVKVHHLQVIRGTLMERMLREGKVVPLSPESYPGLVSAFLEELPSATVVHRLLADAPGEILVAPLWPEKGEILRAVRQHMERGGHWQGRQWEERGKGIREGRREKGESDAETRGPGDAEKN